MKYKKEEISIPRLEQTYNWPGCHGRSHTFVYIKPYTPEEIIAFGIFKEPVNKIDPEFEAVKEKYKADTKLLAEKDNISTVSARERAIAALLKE